MEHGPRTEEKATFIDSKWYVFNQEMALYGKSLHDNKNKTIKAKPGKLFHNGTQYCNVLTFVVYQTHLQMQLIHKHWYLISFDKSRN